MKCAFLLFLPPVSQDDKQVICFGL